MQCVLLMVFVVLASWSSAAASLPTFVEPIMPFPHPHTIIGGISPDMLGLSPDIRVVCRSTCSGCAGDLARKTVDRYSAMLQRRVNMSIAGPKSLLGSGKILGIASTVSICVETLEDTSPASSLGPSMDEAYDLVIEEPSNGTAAAISIQTHTVWGALRGLESVLQLIGFDWVPSSSSGKLAVVRGIPVTIQDSPLFPYRGLMIDTGRHFLPVPFIRRILDGLETMKMNVLHWHITDSESFPLRLEGEFGQLAQAAAYHPLATYSEAEVRDLVAYARARGVRVIPEIDMPAHCSFGRAALSANLTVPCGRDSSILNPTLDALYPFLARFFSRVASLFPDPLLMLGGDEVDKDCYARDPGVAKWLKEHGANASDLQNIFWRRVQTEVMSRLYTPDPQSGGSRRLDRTLYLWMADDPNKGALQKHKIVHPPSIAILNPRSTVVNVWQTMHRANATLAAGLRTVLSIGWQNNTGFGLGWYLPRLCPWELRWSRRPCHELGCNLTHPPSDLLGGETCAWGTVINADNFGHYAWVGTAAVAERLWSPDAVNNLTESKAEDRMATQARP